ncbi:MAG: hypothetical protein NT075_11510 [Chloroflexi bacterium]|nr:hypothetical protein [Chloroflexota bacterium]
MCYSMLPTKAEDPPFINKPAIPIMYGHRWRKALCLALFMLLTPGVTRVAQADSCMDLVADSSLESGYGWSIKTHGGYTLLSTVQAHTGAGSAYLAGVDNANDLLGTKLALPADQASLLLSFWWKVNSEDRSDVNDKFAVQIVDGAGKMHKNLFTLGSERASNQWQQTTIDLQDFANQQVQLQFVAKTDEALVTDFFVDDVEVNACGG